MLTTKTFFALCLTLTSCCACVILLEKITKESKNSTTLITFAAYLSIIIQGLILKPHFLTNNKIPVKHYIFITLLFFSTNLLNNLALDYNVDMPTLLIFRSGSLLANMVVSIIAFRRSYPVSKYIAVVMVTGGIILATMASAELKQKGDVSSEGMATWFIGIAMLTYSLFGSAVMGVFQEKLFIKFGKHQEETLFYTHILGLAAFGFNYKQILVSVIDFNTSAPLVILEAASVPRLWVMLSFNVLLQNVCIKCIYYLLSEWSSLAVTLVTTLRKFLSLLLSIYLFSNPFTVVHWMGTGLVFAGSALFSGLIPLPGGEKEKSS